MTTELSTELRRPHQKVGDTAVDYSEHLWQAQPERWKCLTCGAITKTIPPEVPTPVDWLPERYEKVTKDERALVPFVAGKGMS